MSIKTQDYINVHRQAERLGCNTPVTFSLIPINFERVNTKSELVHYEEVITLRKVFARNQLVESKLEVGSEHFKYKGLKNANVFLPILFFGFAAWAENPNLISIALNVVSNYVTDFFKGKGNINDEAQLEIIVEVEPDKRFIKISYAGPSEGIKNIDISKIIKESKKS